MTNDEQQHDSTEGWPDEPDKDELLDFAGKLRQARPQLPESAKRNIARAMRREMALQHGGPVSVWPLRAAAAVLLFVGAGYFLFTTMARPALQPPQPRVVDTRRFKADEQRKAESARLLREFDAEGELQRKLALLPELSRVCTNEELSPGARYLLALSLLRPHLSWHAPYSPPRLAEAAKAAGHAATHIDEYWQDAHTGEDWLIDESARRTAEAERKARTARAALERVQDASPTLFWRIDDPQHADIARVTKLLQGIKAGEVATRARRWLLDIRRNNTVITFDVCGAYPLSNDAPVVMDVRCVDKTSFKLYRVRKAEQLAAVCEHIGQHFIFRDYGLQDNAQELAMEHLAAMRQGLARNHVEQTAPPRAPELPAADLVQEWSCDVSDLPVVKSHRHGRMWDDDEEDDAEAEYFDDRCERFRDRIEKTYDPRDTLSPWQCGRIVRIPGKALPHDGAYVLVGEANGQKAYAPVLVNPLSLTLRRCRDGVFALVSDADGKEPAAGAQIVAKGMLGDSVADNTGAAFARVFAAGERPILACKGERFALGGFGRIFDGVYKLDTDWFWRDRLHALRALREQPKSQEANVYADRHVVAAYTDRPTYRPGQEVNFKLVVRRLAKTPGAGAPGSREREFRADDFELSSALELPPVGAPVRYDVVNPRGRSVATGQLALNDFGTAAGKVSLSSEEATGAYSLCVSLGGASYVVPQVFALKYYRRPNFDVTVTGAPEQISARQTLKLAIAARYYFGKPVGAGDVDVRLVRKNDWKSLALAVGKVSSDGNAALEMELPETLSGGQYLLLCTLTDESGRAVTRTTACSVAGPTQRAAPFLSELPRFVAAGKAFAVAVSAAEIVATQVRRHDKETRTTRLRFAAQDGQAAVVLNAPGWYTLSAGHEEADIFAYGGNESPFATGVQGAQELRAKGTPPPAVPKWVNLSDYELEEDGESREYADSADLLALLDRHQAQVGETLRVLVYTPCRRARLLFTIEGRTVMDYLVAWTPNEPGSYHVVEIPMKPRYAPNFYLQGRVIAVEGEARAAAEMASALREQNALEQTEQDYGEDPRWCRVDVTDPRPPSAAEKLRIAVETDRQEYRPGDTVNARLRVTGLNGTPSQAEVSLSAVDESVYTFGEDTPSAVTRAFGSLRGPEAYYRKTWRCSTGKRTAELGKLRELAQEAMKALDKTQQLAKQLERLQQLAAAPDQRLPLSSLGAMPAGTLLLPSVRTDFRETAAWLPQLRSDADGTIRTSFVLPDSLTAWRLSAVGITRNTEVGTGRAQLRTRLPLSAQVFLPRFAVETDRLLLTALIHNEADQPRTCQAKWSIEGATLEGWEEPKTAGTVTRDGDRSECSAQVSVGARASTRLAVWLTMTQPGTVKVEFSAGDGKEADAERREIPVYPLGRAREVALSGAFDGQGRLNLPAGFAAQDLRVTLARGNVAQALEGLGYLVEYPYGCVEQTMSRFLPAVMVAHAAQKAPLSLPPDIERRLPDVLSKGLARLYNFQHGDGGWGWWEHDQTNNHMTVYVLYGLARCQSAGTRTDSAVIKRGCDYVLSEIRSGRLKNDVASPLGRALQHDELESAAWLAVALAGHADAPELAAAAERALRESASAAACCSLALACKAAGRDELAGKLWRKAEDWAPQHADEIALALRCSVAFGAPMKTCKRHADTLLARRSDNRWANTRSTSAAIDALADMLPYAQAASRARSVTIAVGGKTALDVKGDAELRRMVHSVRLSGRALQGDGLRVEMSAQCPEKLHYALTASGTQRLDTMEPIGSGIRLVRRYTRMDGSPLQGDVRRGDCVAVRLDVELTGPQSYLIVEDRLPAGWEVADERLAGRAARRAAHVEFRDDRVCAFFTHLEAGHHELLYFLRAETPGTSHVLPGCAYPMYDEKNRGETGGATLQVK